MVRGELGLAAGQCVLLYKATPEPPHPAMTWQSLLAISKCFSADPAAPLDLPCIDGLPAVYVKVPAVRTAAAGADFVTPQPTLTAPGLGHAAVADAGRTAAAISTGSSSGVSAGSAAGAAAGGGSAGSAGKARVHKAWAPLSFYIARIGFLVRQTNGMYIMRANADNMTLRLGAAEDEANVDLVVPDYASMTMEERRARLRQIRKTVLAGYDAAARMVLQQYDADADEVLVKIGKHASRHNGFIKSKNLGDPTCEDQAGLEAFKNRDKTEWLQEDTTTAEQKLMAQSFRLVDAGLAAGDLPEEIKTLAAKPTIAEARHAAAAARQERERGRGSKCAIGLRRRSQQPRLASQRSWALVDHAGCWRTQ